MQGDRQEEVSRKRERGGEGKVNDTHSLIHSLNHQIPS